MPFSVSFIPSHTTRSLMVEPACRRRSGQVDSWFSKKRSTLGAALVLTSPGIPMLFQGQELLEDRWFQDKDPIAWSRTEDEHGILGMYRDLIVLRRNRSGVTRGLCGQNIHIYHFDDEAKLIAFHRWDKQGPTDSVVVVVNMMNQNRDGYVIGFPRAGLWKTDDITIAVLIHHIHYDNDAIGWTLFVPTMESDQLGPI